MRGRLRLGLAAQLLLAFAALVIPLLIFSVWSFQRSLQERRDTALDDAVESAETAALLVFGLLRDLDSTSALMSGTFGQEARPLDQATAGPALTAMVERYPVVRAAFLTGPAGRVIAAQRGEGIGVDLGARPYVQALLGGEEFVLTDAVVGLQSGEPTVTMARTVRAPDGALRALLVIAFYPGQLAELFPQGLPPDANLTVLDRRGHLVYGSAAPDLPAAARDLSGSPLVRAALAGEVARSDGTIGVDGEERLGALAPVRDYGWVAGYSRTTESVVGPLERLYRRQIGGLAAVALLAGLAALLLSRGLTRRLRRLAAHAGAFGRGETSRPVPVGGPAELQDLATAFNAMATEVQTRFAEREAAEARYRGIFEGALEGIFQTGFDGRFRTVNPSAARLLGYDSPEQLMASVTDVRHLYADPARFEAYLREMRARGVVTDFEFEVRRRDGGTRWVTLNARALHGEDGRIAQVEGMATDITDRKAAAETRLRLAAIVDSSDDAIIGKTLDGVITSWNRAAERMYGYAAEEAVGRSIALLVPDDRPDELPAILARLRRGEPISRYETERVRRDGTRLTVALTISPIEHEGRIIGASTIARDITERKRAETAARLLAEITRELVAAGVDLPVLLDRVARRTAELLGDGCLLRLLSDDGQTLEPAGFHHTDAALAEEIRAMLAVPYRADEGLDGEVLRTGRAVLLPVVDHEALLAETQPMLRALVDRIALRSIVVAPVRSRGRILGTLGVGRNVPDRPFTEADAALLQEIADRAGLAIDNARLYRDAREALRVRDEFLSSLSHDLRTPLATIKGMAQLLGRQLGRLDLAEARRLGERAATIDRSAARMGAMVDELLDLARLQAGRPLELNRAAVDLVALARAAIEEQAALNPGHTLRLAAEAPALVGVWDAARLERVLSNLLSNATKYSPDGGEVAVGVRSVAGDDGAAWAALSVRDRGVGIPAGDLPFIFEWFHRGANVAGRVGGIGIGLAGVKQIVERHGGTIDVASTEGTGTLVTVRLPLADPELEHGEERA